MRSVIQRSPSPRAAWRGVASFLRPLALLGAFAVFAGPAAAQTQKTLSVTMPTTTAQEGTIGADAIYAVNFAMSDGVSRALVEVCVSGTATGDDVHREPGERGWPDYEFIDHQGGDWSFNASGCTDLTLPPPNADHFRLRLIRDALPESNETVILTLNRSSSTPADVQISSTQGSVTFTIENDDALDANSPDGDYQVPVDWELTPPGLVAGDRFRLLFLSSTKRDATSTDIADYNAHVQAAVRAAGAHPAARPYSTLFRAVGCTSAEDATANTKTRSTDPDVPIYWLNGPKAADDYADFYDMSWDAVSLTDHRNESGVAGAEEWPWTGCNHNGTAAAEPLGNSPNVVYGRTGTPVNGPLSEGSDGRAQQRTLYALSPVFTAGPYLWSMSMATTSAQEGNPGATAQYKVTFTGSPSYPWPASNLLLANLCVGGSATLGTDYEIVDAGGGAWEFRGLCAHDFNLSTTAQDISVKPLGDADVEVDETVVATMTRHPETPADVVIDTAKDSVTFTILNDDMATPPAITIAGGSPVTEGANASFTVSASPAPLANLDVNLTVEDAPNSDFVASTNEGSGKTVTINANASSAAFTVATVNDSGAGADEPNGPVKVTVNTGNGYTVGSPDNASVTVNDNDATTVTLAGSSANVTEGGTKTFTLTLNRGLRSGETLTAPLSFTGVAIRNTDYTMTGAAHATIAYSNLNTGSASVKFTGPGTGVSATVATITLTAAADNTAETTAETVNIGLGSVSHTGLGGGANGTDNLATFSIEDPVLPVVSIAAGATVTEGANASFTVSASPAPLANLDVNLTVEDAPNSDFVASTNEGSGKTVTINARTSSAAFTVATVNDSGAGGDEPNGPVKVTVNTGNGYTVGSPDNASVTVNDNDATTVTLAGSSANVTEGGTKTFTLTLNRGLRSGETLTAPLTFAGVAIRNTDYTMTGAAHATIAYSNLNAGSASVKFTGPGAGVSATVATITLTAAADNTAETTAETVNIGLGSVSHTGLGGGASGVDNLANFSIEDPGQAKAGVEVDLGGSRIELTEGGAAGSFTLVLTKAPVANVTVEATANRPEKAKIHTTGSPGASVTLTFTPVSWNVKQTVTVTPQEDADGEDEGLSILFVVTGTGEYQNVNLNSVSIVVVDDDDSPSPPPPPPSGPSSPPPPRPSPPPPSPGPGGPSEAAFDVVSGAECGEEICTTYTGAEVTLRAAAVGFGSLSWDTGDGGRRSGGSLVHAWRAPGFYRVTLTVAGGGEATRRFLVRPATPAGFCWPDAETRCFLEERYRVEVVWWTAGVEPQPATVVHEGPDDSGLFRFFDPNNWEVLVKVLDACGPGLNDHVWVFAASTTDLGYEIAVTDTLGVDPSRIYRNEPGTSAAAITDTKAFPKGCQR